MPSSTERAYQNHASFALEDITDGSTSAVTLPDVCAKAVRMHALSRLRTRYFTSRMLADSVMDVMLSLFIGELQEIELSEATLALANLLSREEITLLVNNLVHAGLAVVTGDEPERRKVGLTPIGSARTRSYVNDYPVV